MHTRIVKLAAALAALAALAVGGSALANAAQKAHKSPPPAKVQQGVPAAKGSSSESPEGTAESEPAAADTDNVQQGDQTGSDQSDAQQESAGSESSASDGPGGYADTNPNADTQQTGEH
jgi:hypothetical protein